MINLERDGDVFVMTMDAGENRWNTNFARAFDARLDEALASEGPAALVTRSSDPKFFSNGLDLDWRRGEGDGEGGECKRARRSRTDTEGNTTATQ